MTFVYKIARKFSAGTLRGFVSKRTRGLIVVVVSMAQYGFYGPQIVLSNCAFVS